MKSQYVKNLPANAIVNKIDSNQPFEPREIIICQNPPVSLFQLIDGASETARVYGIQRPSADWRVKHYEKEIDKGELKSIIVSLVQFRDGSKLVLATEDGAHKNKAALQKDFKGIVLIEVYKVETLEKARILASKFDSRVASRSYATTIMYVYGANPEYSQEHIKMFTSSVLHLLAGANDIDSKIAESYPMFNGKLKAHSFENVCRVKLAFEDSVLKWFSSEFSIARREKSKLHNIGILTAMLQSYLAYGPEVKVFWSRYFSGCNIAEGSALGKLRDTVLAGRGAGGRFLIDNYRMAVWAFLAETGRHNISGHFKVGAPYHMKFGYLPGYKPQRSQQKKSSPKMAITMTTVASVKAT